jgi:hypothetical protein
MAPVAELPSPLGCPGIRDDWSNLGREIHDGFTLCSMNKWIVICVVALVFGFGGAAGAVAVMHDQLQGDQGADGLTGAPGQAGRDGADGVNGLRGGRGPAGRPGRAGKDGKHGKRGVAAPKAPPTATDLGTRDCAGSSVEVVTKARLDAAKKLVVVKKQICLVAPSTARGGSTD